VGQPSLILITEDEILIQDIVVEGLKEAGFEVATADHGAEAIKHLESAPEKIRALVTDIQLGKGPDGWDVARRARELVPDMPVVYVTADSAGDWASKGVPGSVVIQKPFANAQLITAVSNLLIDLDTHRLV
jgi:DNA-binding response OmpR family regulator